MPDQTLRNRPPAAERKFLEAGRREPNQPEASWRAAGATNRAAHTQRIPNSCHGATASLLRGDHLVRSKWSRAQNRANRATLELQSKTQEDVGPPLEIGA